MQTISQSVKIPGETLSQVIFFYNRETQKAERYISPANAGRELTAKEQKYGGQTNGKKIVARAY